MDILSFLPGYGFDSLRQRLVALATSLLGIHGSFFRARERQVVSCRWRSLAWGNGRTGWRRRRITPCLAIFIATNGGSHSKPYPRVLSGTDLFWKSHYSSYQQLILTNTVTASVFIMMPPVPGLLERTRHKHMALSRPSGTGLSSSFPIGVERICRTHQSCASEPIKKGCFIILI